MLLRHYLVFIYSVCTFLIMGSPAHAQKQTLVYDVYAGGVRVVEAMMDIDMEKERYNIAFSAYTKGILGKLVPWKGTFESHGWVNEGGALSPKLHKSTTTWRGEEEILEYEFAKNGDFVGYFVTDEYSDRGKREVDPVLSDDTIDVLTATLSVFNQVGNGKQCAGEAEIFDGKRRFKQIFSPGGQDTLQASKYNIYEGEAAMCTVEVQPVAGKWSEKPRGWMSIQEQGRDKGTMPTVWTASVIEGQPAVPVKVKIKTDHGTMFMHLTQILHNK